jgi:transcriptional regulator with XRE-family HTH domain
VKPRTRPATARAGGRGARSPGETGAAATRRPEATTGDVLRGLREAAGLTQRGLAGQLADEHQSAAAWQVSLARYETGERTPGPEALRAILEAVGASEVQRCRAAVGAVLTPSVLAAWVEAYGGAAVADALRGYAGVVGISAEMAKRKRRERVEELVSVAEATRRKGGG